ncbi:MAG: GGDEF domain-containing protein [Gammaproteobacteria bacterium]|nr:GGDEF domain-containing protein [Gammaproteobacteria bacterium]
MSWYALRRLTFPALLFLGAAIGLRSVSALSSPYQLLLNWLPIVTFGGAIALSVYFNNARRFTGALLLLVMYLVIQSQLQVPLEDPRALVIYSMLSIAVPVVGALVLFMHEPALKGRNGMLLASLMPLLVVSGWLVQQFYSGPAAAFVEAWLPIRGLPGSMLSLAAIGCFALVIAAAFWILVERDDENAAAILGSMLFAMITLAHLGRPKISAIMLGAAGLSQIASLVRSSFDMAFCDELTGLLGRRAFNDRLKSLGRRYAIAMVDVDHFKQFNDTYGHDVGDDVLKMVARQIDRVRGGGTAYRYGGEEFSVIFPGKDADHCEAFLEEIRRNVERYHLALRDTKKREIPEKEAQRRRGRRVKGRGEQSVSVTISIGLAEPDDTHAMPEDVVKAADEALYRAKQSGRNQIAY